jgi:hypothetical protein
MKLTNDRLQDLFVLARPEEPNDQHVPPRSVQRKSGTSVRLCPEASHFVDVLQKMRLDGGYPHTSKNDVINDLIIAGGKAYYGLKDLKEQKPSDEKTKTN